MNNAIKKRFLETFMNDLLSTSCTKINKIEYDNDKILTKRYVFNVDYVHYIT